MKMLVKYIFPPFSQNLWYTKKNRIYSIHNQARLQVAVLSLPVITKLTNGLNSASTDIELSTWKVLINVFQLAIISKNNLQKKPINLLVNYLNKYRIYNKFHIYKCVFININSQNKKIDSFIIDILDKR